MQSMLPSGRRLAIDYGEVRIGLAISDITGLIAAPHKTLIHDSDDISRSITAIIESIGEEEIMVVYVGLPLHLSGEESSSSQKARIFATALKEEIGSKINVRLVDERLSTKSAVNQAHLIGRKLDRDEIDQMAAVSILEFALNVERSSGNLAGNDL